MIRSNPLFLLLHHHPQGRSATLLHRIPTTNTKTNTKTKPILRSFSNTLSSLKESKPSSPPSLPFRPRQRAPKPLLTHSKPKTSRFINKPYRPLAPSSILHNENESEEDGGGTNMPDIHAHQRLHEQSMLNSEQEQEEGEGGMWIHPIDRTNNYQPKDDQQRPVSFSRAPDALRYLRDRQTTLLDKNADNQDIDDDDDDDDDEFYQRLSAHNTTPNVEHILRLADYFSSPEGSTEDNVFTRKVRNLPLGPQAIHELEHKLIQQQKYTWLEDHLGIDRPTSAQQGLEPEFPNLYRQSSHDTNTNNTTNDDSSYDPNQKAYGPWAESIISLNRVQKVTRGGTTVRYRALAIGGNLNGCGGYGVAKANTPPEAVALACQRTRRNIVFVDRYQNSGLTEDLVGKHNSCRVLIRATGRGRGLKGNPLACEILKYMGITDCTVKTHGNRNKYNVVYGVFKALLTHEGLEDIAMKRGKRLLNLERARRLQV